MIHKKKCVCGHLLDVEDVYQQGRADAIEEIRNCNDCGNCDAYDQTRNCCPHWCGVISETIEDAKAQARKDAIEEVFKELNLRIESLYALTKTDKMRSLLGRVLFVIGRYEEQMKEQNHEID